MKKKQKIDVRTEIHSIKESVEGVSVFVHNLSRDIQMLTDDVRKLQNIKKIQDAENTKFKCLPQMYETEIKIVNWLNKQAKKYVRISAYAYINRASKFTNKFNTVKKSIYQNPLYAYDLVKDKSKTADNMISEMFFQLSNRDIDIEVFQNELLELAGFFKETGIKSIEGGK